MKAPLYAQNLITLVVMMYLLIILIVPNKPELPNYLVSLLVGCSIITVVRNFNPYWIIQLGFYSIMMLAIYFAIDYGTKIHLTPKDIEQYIRSIIVGAIFLVVNLIFYYFFTYES